MTVGTTSISLIHAIQASDEDAWQTVIERYGPLVYGWCRRAGLQPEDSADVMQDVFLAASRNIARFRRARETDSFRGWLYTIARNKIRDIHRHRQQRPRASGGSSALHAFMGVPMPTSDSTETSHASSSLQCALTRIREEFSEQTWSAFWLMAVESLESSEIATRLGMTPNAVRLAKGRVVRRLRAELPEKNTDS